MMVNLDNASSSVGFGLEDLLHLNNNNESEAKSEASNSGESVEKVRSLVCHFVHAFSQLKGCVIIYLRDKQWKS